MKHIAIVIAMVSMMVGCVAETGESEVETFEDETIYAEEASATETEGENIGTSSEELMGRSRPRFVLCADGAGCGRWWHGPCAS